MTVLRVLNNPQLVAKPTRERVQAAIRELDYVVNELARQIDGLRPSCELLATQGPRTPEALNSHRESFLLGSQINSAAPGFPTIFPF